MAPPTQFLDRAGTMSLEADRRRHHERAPAHGNDAHARRHRFLTPAIASTSYQADRHSESSPEKCAACRRVTPLETDTVPSRAVVPECQAENESRHQPNECAESR